MGFDTAGFFWPPDSQLLWYLRKINRIINHVYFIAEVMLQMDTSFSGVNLMADASC